MTPARSESCAISGAKGFLRLSRTVSGSITSTVSSAATSDLRRLSGRCMARSRLSATAAASRSVPSENLTPGRSRKVTALPSEDVSQESASCGTKCRSGAASINLLHKFVSTIRPTKL